MCSRCSASALLETAEQSSSASMPVHAARVGLQLRSAASSSSSSAHRLFERPGHGQAERFAEAERGFRARGGRNPLTISTGARKSCSARKRSNSTPSMPGMPRSSATSVGRFGQESRRGTARRSTVTVGSKPHLAGGAGEEFGRAPARRRSAATAAASFRLLLSSTPALRSLTHQRQQTKRSFNPIRP